MAVGLQRVAYLTHLRGREERLETSIVSRDADWMQMLLSKKRGSEEGGFVGDKEWDGKAEARQIGGVSQITNSPTARTSMASVDSAEPAAAWGEVENLDGQGRPRQTAGHLCKSLRCKN